jgi:hypothetical protein
VAARSRPHSTIFSPIPVTKPVKRGIKILTNELPSDSPLLVYSGVCIAISCTKKEIYSILSSSCVPLPAQRKKSTPFYPPHALRNAPCLLALLPLLFGSGALLPRPQPQSGSSPGPPQTPPPSPSPFELPDPAGPSLPRRRPRRCRCLKRQGPQGVASCHR